MKELIIELKNGNKIVCGQGNAYLYGGYLRLIDKNDKELLYYDVQEWENEPESIIGAFFNKCFQVENQMKK